MSFSLWHLLTKGEKVRAELLMSTIIIRIFQQRPIVDTIPRRPLDLKWIMFWIIMMISIWPSFVVFPDHYEQHHTIVVWASSRALNHHLQEERTNNFYKVGEGQSMVQEDNHELISTFGENFRNCWNMSQSMSHMLLFARSMVVEQWIPNSFGCSNIALWTKYGIAKYWANTEMEPLLFTSFIYFDNVGESYDLCSKVGFWENKLKLSCHELLCENTNDNLIAHVEEMTEKQTSIFDWINYCQYCLKNNTLRSYKLKASIRQKKFFQC